MKTFVPTKNDSAYLEFESEIRDKIRNLPTEMFTTSVGNLFGTYLSGLPYSERQHYNCHCCRRFFDKYAGLVTINDKGVKQPVLWEGNFPFYFRRSQELLCRVIGNSDVTGVFINEDKVWGTPVTGQWTHISGHPKVVHTSKTKTAFQVMAEKKQDFEMLSTALREYSVRQLEIAVTILEADTLDRSEKTLGNAKWFLDLKRRTEYKSTPIRNNLIWLAVAKAPPGWCHIRTTMISTLLADIKEGKDLDLIKKNWDQKMHPLKYQRPTAPLKTGQVQAANKLIEQLEAQGSLQRRFARLEEVKCFWHPSNTKSTNQGGTFDHLLSKKEIKRLQIPEKKITWTRFRQEVLPKALEIEYLTPLKRDSFVAVVTAVNPTAPPILQWDFPEKRNPLSHFFKAHGSYASEWNLTPDKWTKVTGISPSPCHIDKVLEHFGEMAILYLEDCKLCNHLNKGGGFFKECLKSEFHSISDTMAAYADRHVVTGNGTANGIALQKGLEYSCHVRVTTTASVERYHIDRWD